MNRLCLIAIAALLIASPPDVGAAAPATQPAAAGAAATPPVPATQPAALAAAPPAPTAPTTPKAEPATFRFQFDGAPYTTVLQQFAQSIHKPLVGDLNIDGQLTFFDSQPYTFAEAMDTLNVILAMRGYTLMDTGRFLELVKLQDISHMPIKILNGLDHAKHLRPGQIVTVVLPLKFVDAESVAKAVTPMVSTFGKVAPLGTGKGIIITDRLSNIQRIRQLIAQLDTNDLVAQRIEHYDLKNASAATAAKVIDSLFGKRTVTKPGSHGKTHTVPVKGPSLQTSYDDRTNTLFLKGSADLLTMAEQVLKQLDAAQNPSEGDLRLFKLQHARAADLATTLRETFGVSRRGRNNKSGITIVPDAGTNRIVVSAPQADMAKIETLINKLDQASAVTTGVKIVHLKSANAEQLSRIVSASVVSRDARGRSRAAVRVSADARSNSLILSGAPADLATAESLIAQLDTDKAQQAREIHVVHLAGGDARALAQSLSRLFDQRNGRHGGGSTLTVEADSASNSLFIAAAPGDWQQIQSILKTLKASTGELTTPTTRLIPLKHARAADLAKTLSTIYSRRSSRRPGQEQIPVVVTAASRTNSLLISASQTDQQAIGDLIASLDVPSDTAAATIRMIRVQSADATKLAASLKAMLPRNARDVAIEADAATNSVLLRAPADQQKALTDLIAKLDQPAQNAAQELRIVAVKHASATQLAQTLTQLSESASANLPWWARRSNKEDGEKLHIAAAPGDHALILQGPHPKVEQAATLIASLDTGESPGQVEVRTYQLKTSKATDLARSLEQLFAKQRSREETGNSVPQPRFEADATTNQLIVAATAPQFAKIEGLIDKIQAAPTLARQVRTFHLEHAKATELVAVLQPLLQDPSQQLPWWARRNSNAATVQVAAISKLNDIVVQGPPDRLKLAEQLIKTLDTPGAAADRAIQVVHLVKAEADTLARAVVRSLPETARRGRNSNADADRVTVTAEPNSNSVLVAGPRDRIADVVAMIEKLDAQAKRDAVAVHVYPLHHAQASDLAPSITGMFQQLMGRRGSRAKAGPLAVSADTRTNSLIVSTTPAQFVLVDQLIKSLDQTTPHTQRDVRYVYLQNADASSVAFKLQALFLDRKLADRPLIDADTYVNALTIIADDADMTMIESVVRKLDDAAKDTTIHVRVMPLSGVRAQAMAELVRKVYGQMTGRQVILTPESAATQPGADRDAGELLGVREPSLPAEVAAGKAPATQPAASATQPGGDAVDTRVTITVDRGANAMIVSGQRKDLDAIESLVEQLATTAGSSEAELRIFHLKQADPATVARMLDSLFNPKTQPRPVAKGKRPAPLPPPVISAVADARTHSVIVRAKPVDFDVIAALVQQLDAGKTVPSEVRLFPLKNAQAAAVAQNLRDLFTLGGSAVSTKRKSHGKARTQPTPQQQRAAMVRKVLTLEQGKTSVSLTDAVSITANEQDNVVIVTAPSKVMTLIARLLQELDQSAAQTSVPIVRMYPLEHADPATTVANLQQLFAQRGKSGRGKTPIIPVFTANDPAHMVIVSATGVQQPLIAQVIADLDHAQAGQTLSVKVIHLQHADATSVASALLGTLEQPGSGGRNRRRGKSTGDATLRISADASSNSLVVRATPQEHERIAELIAHLDNAPLEQMPVRLIALTNADAANVAKILNQVFSSGGQSRRGRRGRGNAAPRVVIEADAAAKSLMVRADDATFQKIRELAMKLDADTQVGQAQQTLIALEHAQAQMIAQALNQAFAPRRGERPVPDEQVQVVAEPASNSLIVTANADNLVKVQALLKKLDTAGASGVQTQLLVLKNAKAQEVADVLSHVVQATSGLQQRGRRGRGGSAAQTVVSADTGSNALVMAGPANQLAGLIEMAHQLDAASTGAATGVYIIPLQTGEAADVAQTVKDLYAQQTKAARGSHQTVPSLAVSADVRANAIVLATTQQTYQRVNEWVGQLEKMKPSRSAVHLITLEHADADEVQQAIDQIYNPHSGGSSRGRGRNRNANSSSNAVETTSLPQQRAILVTAGDDDYQQIAKLVASLDEAAKGAAATVKVFELKHANNTIVAQALTRMYAQSRSQRGKQAQQPVRITALAHTDAVVVTAVPDKVAEVGHLIEQLDQKDVMKDVTFRIYPLTNATPSKVVATLQQLLKQIKTTRPDEPITAQADDRTRSIIVSAQGDVFDQIDKIIKQLDKDPAYAEANVLVIPLQHADAARLAAVLRDMLKPGKNGALTPEAAALQEQVRRLRISGHNHDHLPDLDLTKPIKITPDPQQPGQAGSNRLLISSTADNLKAMSAIVRILDTVPVTDAVRVFPLRHADATLLKKTLDSLFAKPRGKQAPTKPAPTIVADVRTNSLVVSGDDDSLDMVTVLLHRLDAKLPLALRDIHLVPLAHAEAPTLAKTLQSMMDARVQRAAALGGGDAAALKTIVLADSRSNALIVGGSKQSYELVKDLAKQLDDASPALNGRIQLFALEHADAGTLSTTLSNLFQKRYQAARTPEQQRQQPVILPDLRINALLVAATDDDSKAIKSLLAKLDVKLTDPAVRLSVLPLQFNDAGAVGPMIQQLFAARLKSMTPQGQPPNPQDRVDVAVDALSNSLVISASKQNLGLIHDLLAKVDVEPSAENGVVQIFHLERADAQRIAGLLQQLVSQGLYKPGTVTSGNNAAQRAREKVAITADVRTNVLVISASKENLAILGQIVHTLDSTKDYAALGDVRVYTLKHADASKLAPTLQQFFTSKLAGERTATGDTHVLPVTVIADARTNALLVSGGRDAFKTIAAMVAQLDASDVTPAGDFRVFYLKRSTAASVQPMLQQLFANRVARGTAKDPVTVVADARSNALIVSASKTDMPLVVSLIARLEAVPPQQANVQVFPLAKANAEQVAQTLRDLLGQKAAGTAGGAANGGVVVSVDDRLNAIVVSGGDADIKQAAALVKQLDTAQGAKVTEIRIFRLLNADATGLAQILTSTLTQKPAALPGVNANRQALLQFVSRSDDGKKLITSALQQGLLIVPDARTNALVVSAPADNMPLLSNLIHSLDTTSPQAAQIRVFQLVNADAEQMATILRDLFRLQGNGIAAPNSHEVEYTLATPGSNGSPHGKIVKTSATPGSPGSPGSGSTADGKADGTGGDPSGGPSVTLGSAEQYALSVTVDPRTNSLLVGGTDHYVQLAAQIIQKLDSSPAQERITKVYRLRNAQATDIQTALNTFLDQERQRVVQVLGNNRMGAAQRLLDQQVAIVAEKTSNTLLVSASPRYYNTIASMIKQLDQPPPQVLIQVLLAEVTLTNNTDLGFEWNYKFGVGGAKASTGTDFGVAGDLARNGGFNFTLTGGHLTMLLRALQEQGRLNVLSRPQILATDNQEASIQVGQDVPFVTNSRISDEGAVFNTIQYQSVGIILQVLPRITADGAVKLEVSPQVSSIADSTVPISEGVNAIIINKRQAQTTVTVQDGHTIVLGGLITTQDNDQIKKVPILGDIPIIGALFKTETHSKQRTELLIIMTPHVLRSPKDADRITDNQISQLDLLRTMKPGQVPSEIYKTLNHATSPQAAPATRPALPPVTPIDRKAVTASAVISGGATEKEQR